MIDRIFCIVKTWNLRQYPDTLLRFSFVLVVRSNSISVKVKNAGRSLAPMG